MGHIGNSALAAAEQLQKEGLSVAVYDMRYLKPIDTQLLDEIFNRGFRRLVTLEDGVKKGGLGSAVLEYYASVGKTLPITQLGLPDSFVSHGTVAQLQRDCGIDVDGIVNACRV